MCSGLVHTSQTKLIGAFKSRVMISSLSAAGDKVLLSFSLCMLLGFFVLYFVQVNFKGIQLLRPELSILFHPTRNLVQLFQFGFAMSFTAMLLYRYQSAFGKYFNVFRYRGAADMKFIGDRIQV